MSRNETITPAEVGRRLNRTQGTIEKWLRNKQFPVGMALYDEISDRWSYIIPREAFEHWMSGTTTVYVERCSDIGFTKTDGERETIKNAGV